MRVAIAMLLLLGCSACGTAAPAYHDPDSYCADGTAEQVFSGGEMVGCAGVIEWPSSADLCGGAAAPCAADEWVSLHGAEAPTHSYWTDDALYYGGSSYACYASTAPGNECVPDTSPMRVCAGAYDPEWNECNWYDCGFGSAGENEYFGGCNGNLTAGTLCCP